MDPELDLLGWGSKRFTEPLKVFHTVEEGAQVMRKLAYNQFFDRAAGPWLDPDPLTKRFAYQERNLGATMGKLRSPYNGGGCDLSVDLALVEMDCGFGSLHLQCPPPTFVPDVFYKWFCCQGP